MLYTSLAFCYARIMKAKRQVGIHWRNLILLLASFVIAVVLLRSQLLQQFILDLGSLRYVGIVLAGVFFVSSFTIAPASIVLYVFAKNTSLFSLALLAGFGAMIGDFLMFEFFKDGDLDRELYGLFKQFGGKKLIHVFHSRHFHWMLPVIGAFIIISPLPDELGVSLLGISKLSTPKFILISYLLNTLCMLGLFGTLLFLHV